MSLSILCHEWMTSSYQIGPRKLYPSISHLNKQSQVLIGPYRQDLSLLVLACPTNGDLVPHTSVFGRRSSTVSDQVK
ncbi:unnamed protein product [Acanthoscelides obtectus]|uniref:Uncharacterized protein n=1 Tax=Acanthoscelides obtectus TaxID=200917 RepID=A0A9P0MCC7_ACAOB|nr:unnamed protein product [Acanthoscelides obtectus]CAK1659538.1 hypothetical protein AOBTE_LOCUS21516 [Acanthoscelides obtectus]